MIGTINYSWPGIISPYQHKAGFLAYRSLSLPPSRFPSGTLALTPCLQWRDRAGLSPASLLPVYRQLLLSKRHLMLSYFIFNCSERLWILHALSHIIAHSDSKYKLFFGHSALAFLASFVLFQNAVCCMTSKKIRSPVYHWPGLHGSCLHGGNIWWSETDSRSCPVIYSQSIFRSPYRES